MSLNWKSLVYLFIFIFLESCQKIKSESVVITTDGNGILKSELSYINDTLLNGIAKYYYYPFAKNVLKEEIQYKLGKKDGLYKFYRKDGSLQSKTHFKNDLPNGENFWFYENGKLKEETYWIAGKQYGGGKWYYQNGQLESFNMLDFYGGVFYVIHNDEKGNKLIEDGAVFSSKFVLMYTSDSSQSSINKELIKGGKEVVIKIATAQPPHTKTIIRMGELNKGNMLELPIENYTASYKQTFTEKGNHTLVTVGKIIDLNGNLVKYDSISFGIKVVD